MSAQFQLSKQHRLLRNRDFQTVFRGHKKLSNRCFRVLVHYTNERSYQRFGVIVAKRVARKAVNRNRIRRQVRECFRVRKHKLVQSDLVFIANKASAAATNHELRDSLNQLLDQLSK